MSNKNRPRKGRVTAAELINQLNQDPAYIAMRAEKDAQWEEAKANHQRETMPVLRALQQHGLEVRSLDELRQSRVEYRGAIPILIHWLRKAKSPDVKESIVRTLTVPWAKPEAADPLIGEFLSAPDGSSLKWAIGNALDVVADTTRRYLEAYRLLTGHDLHEEGA